MTAINIKNLAVLLFFALGMFGCAHVPVAESPIEIKHPYQGSFDAIWNAAFEAARRADGAIITEDKSSGLLVYRIFDDASPYGKVYMQVYVKEFPPSDEVLVYLFPKDRSGYCFEGKQRNFFVELDKVLSEEKIE